MPSVDRSAHISAAIADDDLALAVLSSADHKAVFGDTIRRATLVADLQPPARYRDARAAVTFLAAAADIDQAFREIATSPCTTPAVRMLLQQLLAAAETRAARSL